MTYTHSNTDPLGYPHTACKHCLKQVKPLLECKCPERREDGSWEALTQQLLIPPMP
jgi:hypothetical protein